VEEVNSDAPKGAVVSVTPDYKMPQYPDVNIKLFVSNGFRDVEIKLPLPDTDTTVDLQFYVDGKLDSELTDNHTSIMPKDIGTLEFKTTLAKSSYRVTVKISAAGKNSFVTYAEFLADANKGVCDDSETKLYEFKEPTTSTTNNSDVNNTTTGNNEEPTP
jgi:hypothetical protein